MLDVKIADLLGRGVVEGERVEYKATLNDTVLPGVVKTISAFANDLYEADGGYLVIGVREESGRPGAVEGIPIERADEWQKEVRRRCAEWIEPPYEPRLTVIAHEGRELLVVRAAAGYERPYRFKPDKGKGGIYVRRGSETVQARGETLRQLHQRAALTPFDDRRHPTATSDALDIERVRSYLTATGSSLAAQDSDSLTLLRQLNLVARDNGHWLAKNVGLLLFCTHPEQFFPGAYTELTFFADEGGAVMHDYTLKGPLPDQIREAVRLVEERLPRRIEKGSTAAAHIRPYPPEAVREAVANALMHRDYQLPEPVQVRILPTRLEVISHPGPNAEIPEERVRCGEPLTGIPQRNRRLGLFLRELRLAELKCSGLARICDALRRNGSPPPRFRLTEHAWQVILPIHPTFLPLPPAGPLPIEEGAGGLLLISVGAPSLRDEVVRNLGTQWATRIVLDLAVPDYVEPERFAQVAETLRDRLRAAAEDRRYGELHLFYRGPVIFGPLIGAVVATRKRLHIYYHRDDGQDVLAYTLDRRFLLGRRDADAE